jgi:hypothetical protein
VGRISNGMKPGRNRLHESEAFLEAASRSATPKYNILLNVKFARFEVFTAVTMKNGAFWDVTPRGSCKNRRFGGTQPILY